MINKMPIKPEPYEHQKEAFNFVTGLYKSPNNHQGAALLMEMGCGKTITSIAVAGALYKAGNVKKLLIVCPLSIASVWKEEFEKFADFDYELSVLKGSTEKKAEQLQKMQGAGLKVAVVNYESVWHMEPEFSNWKPDFIIADESHKIKVRPDRALCEVD